MVAGLAVGNAAARTATGSGYSLASGLTCLIATRRIAAGRDAP